MPVHINSFSALFPFSLRILLFCSLFAGSCPLQAYPLENESFAEHGQNVDNFIQRTVSRSREAWNLAIFEFKLAFRYFSEEKIQKAQNDLKARADDAVKNLSDQAADTIHQQIDEMKDKAEEQLNNKVEQAKQQAQQAASDVIEQAQDRP